MNVSAEVRNALSQLPKPATTADVVKYLKMKFPKDKQIQAAIKKSWFGVTVNQQKKLVNQLSISPLLKLPKSVSEPPKCVSPEPPTEFGLKQLAELSKLFTVTTVDMGIRLDPRPGVRPEQMRKISFQWVGLVKAVGEENARKAVELIG